MSEVTWDGLRGRLLESYDRLVRALTRKLGSPDAAREAVHETYLRLERKRGDEVVRNPDGYLFRVAINIDKNRRRTEGRFLPEAEVRGLLEAVDDSPLPERATQARRDVEATREALRRLPARRRAIFEAAWLEGASLPDLARAHGVSLRTVQREIEQATLFIHGWWEENQQGERRDAADGVSRT